MSFGVVTVLLMTWLCISSYVGTCSSVLSQRDQRARYPFVQPDFLDRTPGLSLVINTLANSLFLSVCGVLVKAVCALSAAEVGSSQALVGASALTLLELYFPTSFVVGVLFLEPRDSKTDIRTIGLFTVFERSLKFALCVAKELLPDIMHLAVMGVILLTLMCVTHHWHPVRDITELNQMRLAGYAIALHAVCVQAVAPLLSGHLPQVLLFAGWAIISATSWSLRTCFSARPSHGDYHYLPLLVDGRAAPSVVE